MDFTLKKYGKLIKAIKEAGYPVYTTYDWIKNPGKKGVIIRHDVDRKPKNALRMATLEMENKIRTTYYFRILKHTLKPDIISSIAEMGHEIGYHYEDLSIANGDMEKAIQLFSKHLKTLREITPIHTIAMHGRPLSPYDNRDLWKVYNLDEFNLIGESFLSIDYSDKYYVTDTGRSWLDNSSNIRDRVEVSLNYDVRNTNQLVDLIKSGKIDKIALVAHPERWSDNPIDWGLQYIKDILINIIKRIIKIIRK
jgi:hypothetical protein